MKALIPVLLFLLLFSVLPAQEQIAPDSTAVAGDSVTIGPVSAWTLLHINRSSYISLPVRGLSNYLSLLPGVVSQDGGLHFRGSRDYEVSYLLDGITVTNPFFNSNGVELIPEATEEIDVHTGAYGASLGSTAGAVVLTRMREGGDSLEVLADLRTDDFLRPGKQVWNTSSYGYRNAVVTVGGPLLYGVKFFVAGQHHYMRDRQVMFLEPFRYDSLRTDYNDARGVGVLLPGPVEFQRNYLYNNWYENNTIQANVTFHADVFRVKLIASYSDEREPIGGSWPDALQNYYRHERYPIDKTWTQFAALQFSHDLLPDLSYTVSLSWYRRYERTLDPDFGSSWWLYADSLANAQRGYTGFAWRFSPPYYYSVLDGYTFYDPAYPNASFSKNRQAQVQGGVDVQWKASDQWNLGAGLRYESWKMRYYRVSSISSYLQYLYGYDGLAPRSFSSNEERRTNLMSRGRIDAYGYDYLGSTVDGGIDAPRTPRFFSSYLQAGYTEETVNLSIGGRYEVFDLRSLVPPNAYDLNDFYNSAVGWINESKFGRSEPTTAFLPRVSIAFSDRKGLGIYGSYGKYIQPIPLSMIYRSPRQFSYTAFAYVIFSPYEIPAYIAEPERMTHYEIGLSKTFRQGLTLGVRFYTKEWPNRVQFGYADTTSGSPGHYVTLKNDGASSARGVEISAMLEIGRRFSLAFDGAIAEIKGTTSEPGSNAGPVYAVGWPATVWSDLRQTYLLDYNQTFRGTIGLSVRGFPEDGAFEGVRAMLLLTMNSGHSYTREPLPGPLGSFWVISAGVRYLLDPRQSDPIENPGSSTTPWVMNLDLGISKAFSVGPVRMEVFAHILNLLNTKQVINVYPATGSPDQDGFFESPAGRAWYAKPDFSKFYTDVNLNNRNYYLLATGNDVYGTPRQFRLGVKVEY